MSARLVVADLRLHRPHWPGCNTRRTCTANRIDDAAQTCRAMRWRVGDVIEGDEGNGPERIRITAIGEHSVLARRLPVGERESLWTLQWRCWRKVPKAPRGKR